MIEIQIHSGMCTLEHWRIVRFARRAATKQRASEAKTFTSGYTRFCAETTSCQADDFIHKARCLENVQNVVKHIHHECGLLS